MSKIVFDNELLKVMSTFGYITKVTLRDCFHEENRITFIIAPGKIRQAIGKDNKNIKRLEQKFQKRIRIVEYSPNVLKFIKNMILPLKAEEIVQTDEKTVTIKSTDQKTKGLIIGKNARNLRALEVNVKRYFKDLEEIKVE